MQQQAYINATIDIRIPTEVEYQHFDDVDDEKDMLAERLDKNPDELLKYDDIKIRHAYIEVEEMSIVKINGKPYKFTEHENELIKKNGLTPGMVAKRVRGGWKLLEALNAPYGMRLAEYKEIVLSKIMERESKEREIARQRRKKAELRRKKPHLFNVPQKHPRGRYACYLMENDIFVKVKK